MEVLDPEDVKHETKGVVVEGLKRYPTAEPLKMFRIYRAHFDSLKDAIQELERVRLLGNFLAPDHVAMSEEFLVTYARHGRHDIILCGIQDYVEGEALNPWSPLNKDHLVSLLSTMGFNKDEDVATYTDKWIHHVCEHARNFIGKAKQMIREANHVPDLAGAGNLLLTRSGEIKLVDINNISQVSFDPIVKVDDRGYPVCDKSIQALSLLEQKLLGRPPGKTNSIYKTFLNPERMKEVKAKEESFHLSIKPALSPSETS
jgi:hypothetical protein